MGNQPSSRTLSGHAGAVYECCCSQDGDLVLSASGDSTLSLWELPSLLELRQLKGHGAPVYCCDISGNGSKAISGAMDGNIRVWNVNDGQEIGSFQEHKLAVLSVKFSHDSCRALSASADKTIVHWDVTVNDKGKVEGIKLHTLAGHRNAVNKAVFSPDDVLALSASSDNTLKVWNLKTGKESRTFLGHRDAVLSCNISPDGQMAVSASQDNTLKIWSISNGKELRTLSGHLDAVRSCCFSKDGNMILSGGYDKKCIVWVRTNVNVGNAPTSPDTWLRACSVEGHTRGVTSCTFTPDGMLSISASWDKNLVVSSIDDARLFANLPRGEEVDTLKKLLRDDNLSRTHPAIFSIISEVGAMAGQWKVKLRFCHLCKFFLTYGHVLGSRNPLHNVLLYGQQGCGKAHFARLLARLLHAVKVMPYTLAPTESSSTVTTSAPSVVGDDQGPLVTLRASKLKGSTAEQTSMNCRAFLDKHRGQVIFVRELDMLSNTSETDHCANFVRAIQHFLNDFPNSVTIFLAGSSRTELGKVLLNYQPPTPDTLRNHFPIRFEFDRYEAPELLAIFRRQCAMEQLRFGGTVTDVMLEKTFGLNATFLDGSNGAGTKRLIKMARLEQGKRHDKREGVLESTDIQSAFQKLRQDWFEMHPDQTFSVLQQLQQAQQQQMDKVRTSRKSMGDSEAAMEDAKAALEGLDDSIVGGVEEDGSDDEGWWTLDDYRMFHDKEMKRREDEHRDKMQRERDEYKLVVEQTKQAHTNTLVRMRGAGLSMAERRWHTRTLLLTLQAWTECTIRSTWMHKAASTAQARYAKVAAGKVVREWCINAGRARTLHHKKEVAVRSLRTRLLQRIVHRWYDASEAARVLRINGLRRGAKMCKASYSSMLLRVVWEEWVGVVGEEQALAEVQWAERKKDKEHSEAVAAMAAKHQHDLTDLHLEYQERIRSQKALRRAADNSLQPVRQWQTNATLAATALVTVYAAPTVPALMPYVVATMKQLSFGHWYVAILMLASLVSALRKLVSWIWTSVLPLRVKASCKWLWDTGVDSAIISLAISIGSWPYACASSAHVHKHEDHVTHADACLSCALRVERVAKIVIFGAGFVMCQKLKVLGMQLKRQGLMTFVQARVARMVPSWFYSLHDQNSAEMIVMLQDKTVPVGKKAKACQRLAELANSTSTHSMVNVIVEGGGAVALVDMLAKCVPHMYIREDTLKQLCG
jgi:WD40 repeat protein